MRALYDFLRRKEALDGLKTEGEAAAIHYYAAKKLGLRYDCVRPRRSSASSRGIHYMADEVYGARLPICQHE
jgi:hypothetical protein